MKKWIVVSILILMVGLTHLVLSNKSNEENIEISFNNEYEDLVLELEDDGQAGSILIEQPTLTDEVNYTSENIEKNEMVDEASLFEVVRSFVYFYYDWNYHNKDRSLYDYVTDDFLRYVKYELGDEHEYSNEDEELFYVQDVLIFIENLSVYEPIDERSQRFNIIVEFDVLYDVPHHDIFGRNVVLRLEIIRSESSYLINHKSRLNNDL